MTTAHLDHDTLMQLAADAGLYPENLDGQLYTALRAVERAAMAAERERWARIAESVDHPPASTFAPGGLYDALRREMAEAIRPSPKASTRRCGSRWATLHDRRRSHPPSPRLPGPGARHPAPALALHPAALGGRTAPASGRRQDAAADHHFLNSER